MAREAGPGHGPFGSPIRSSLLKRAPARLLLAQLLELPRQLLRECSGDDVFQRLHHLAQTASRRHDVDCVVTGCTSFQIQAQHGMDRDRCIPLENRLYQRSGR